jgi:hypothetical protein
MGKKFSVEIVGNLCKVCGGHLVYRQRTFCSPVCRRKNYYATKRKPNREFWNEYQRNNLHKRIVAKAKAEGKGLVQCMICGKWFRQVSNHVFHSHKMTAREYKEYLGKDTKKGLLPDDLKELKSWQVFDNGTVKNLAAGKVNWFKPGDDRAGKYKRSEETMTRLKNLHTLNKH